MKHFKSLDQMAIEAVNAFEYSLLENLDRMLDAEWAYYTDEDRQVMREKFDEVRKNREALLVMLWGGGHEIVPRRLDDDNKPDGYLESDREYMEKNRDACVEFLDRMVERQKSS